MIERNVTTALGEEYDVIIVGGGIYGATVLLEAARRGQRALLVERDDFGGATSWNSLRILHGGLRYLQTADLPRFRESVSERQWFCQYFPDLVRILPCIMPLYNRGMKRTSTMRIALCLNDWLSCTRNRGIKGHVRIPNAKLLSKAETIDRFPGVQQAGLCGGALWYDAMMMNSQRVLIEILRWACSLEAVALNYVEAESVMTSSGQVQGIVVRDRIDDRRLEYRGAAVINCAGPWAEGLATRFDENLPSFFNPSLAFNVLLRHPPISESAVAVQVGLGPVFFITPWHNMMLAGTVHAPWTSDGKPLPTAEHVDDFLGQLRTAIPGLKVSLDHVVRIYSGLLPARHKGSNLLTKRPVVYDHQRHGGPRRLVSVCGIKYTTSRRVAQQSLKMISSNGRLNTYLSGTERSAANPRLDLLDDKQLFAHDTDATRKELERIIREEAVVKLDDLVLRRTDWGRDPQEMPRINNRIEKILSDQSIVERKVLG